MQLSNLGISPETERVYRHVLEQPGLERSALVQSTGLDEAEVGVALDQLFELALVVPRGNSALEPVEPTAALERLIDRQLHELLDRIRETLSVRECISSFRDGGQEISRASAADIERVTGREQIQKRLDDLSFFTHYETMSLQPDAYVAEGTFEAICQLDQRILRRGIALRTIYHAKAADDDYVLDYLRQIAGLGADVRITEDPVDQMLVFDRTVAMVPGDRAQPAEVGLLVREPGLLSHFTGRFEQTWKTSRTLTEYIGAKDDQESIDVTDRQVLRALAMADKDEIAARHLQVSVRTFRRYVADLLVRLDASNRFHAALKAKEKGWL